MTEDHPIPEVLANMEKHAELGHECYVKYSCEACGLRQASAEANTWHPDGYECCECGHITKPKGINFMVVMKNPGIRKE